MEDQIDLPITHPSIEPDPERIGRILVVGAAVLDRIFYVDKLPRKGETAIGERMELYPGGKGANQALAARRIGAEVRFLTSVGEDESGKLVLEPLEQEGVEVSGVFRVSDTPTAEAVVSVDEKGDNHIVACPGAYHRFSPEMLEKRAEDFEWAQWLLIQNELPAETVNTALTMAEEHGLKIFFNPAPFKRGAQRPVQEITVLAPNENEAAALLGVREYFSLSAADRTRRWLDFGAEHVLVTLGRHGGEWYNPEGQRRDFAAHKVEAVDTVGAGDAFCGVLVALLAEGVDVQCAIRLANIGAGLSTMVRGAQAGLPLRKDLLEYI